MCACMNTHILFTDSSVFTASVFTDVSVQSEQSSAVVRREKGEEKIDPTRPNNHPILKVNTIFFCIHTSYYL